MASVHDNVYTVQRLLKKFLVGVEFKDAWHSALCGCDHAICRNDRAAFDPRWPFMRALHLF
jgi:hypothetical protein